MLHTLTRIDEKTNTLLLHHKQYYIDISIMGYFLKMFAFNLYVIFLINCFLTSLGKPTLSLWMVRYFTFFFMLNKFLVVCSVWSPWTNKVYPNTPLCLINAPVYPVTGNYKTQICWHSCLGFNSYLYGSMQKFMNSPI